jgi:hypothetical protein
MEAPKKICHQMMNTVWLVNALENALHEPNCLLEELLQEGVFESLSSLRLNPDERVYIEQVLKTFQERLTKTRELLDKCNVCVFRVESNLTSPSSFAIEKRGII